MEITGDIIDKSVTQQPFGTFEPFLTGDDSDAASFYCGVLSALEKLPGVTHSSLNDPSSRIRESFALPKTLPP